MEVIEGQVQQMTRLADDLLKVSPVRPGKMHLRREVDDLRDIGLAEAILNKPSSTPASRLRSRPKGRGMSSVDPREVGSDNHDIDPQKIEA